MKLTLIGGGGVRAVLFTKSLTLKAEQVGITKLVLLDDDSAQLEIISQLCQVVIAQSGIHLELESSTDARAALKDAAYIVTTIRTGKEQSRYTDEQIALNLGVIGQETTGPAGFSMALRTIPVLLDYCKLAKEVAPDAWMFNFSNPSGLVTQALRSAGYDRVIGICDTPSHTKLRMAEAMGIDPKELYVEFFGLNHLSWISKAIYKGDDVLGRLKNDAAFISRVDEFKMFDPDLLKALPYLPNEYLYYYYHREQAMANIVKSGMTRGQMIAQNNAEMLEALKQIDISNQPERALQTYMYYTQKREASYMAIETNGKAKPLPPAEELQLPNSLGYAGVMLDFVDSLQTGAEHNIVLSVPNQGSIAGFDDEDVVEISCSITAEGAKPIQIGDVPESMYLLMRNVKRFERLTVEAINHKSKELAIEALTVHPLVCSYSLAKQLVNDYLQAYQPILGDWR
ncbi:glycosyl hydrolase [Paenibacillus baekrokdamisoli]|uniref:Glycosyl hydrolase n=1 Tax=Paenibacillus baekrokdamisoli TaxID=1712516 RepID=A0A3G9JL65_9BACL|nr:glycoside hydrolase [Paenibacillus baekrokdamisoli]MBB3068958.1 6-phospho-beta-glucosidase [Paenibacillus baekrokdamisoli]BBH23779.1 glycosyl hydrolase [Paenibacillus baekrokdamisoli]